nr:MAG TPA: hypothetical protein [Caudoviricetes sp.]
MFKDHIDDDKMEWLNAEWEDNESFTRAEVGAPAWAEAIKSDGEFLSEGELRELVDESLDDVLPAWSYSDSYLPSQILKAVDPIAYRCACQEIISVFVEDGSIRTLWGSAE